MSWLRERIGRFVAERPSLARVVANAGWLSLEKVLRLFLGLLVGLWVARHLGPDKYGLLNYALAMIGLLASISTLGLEEIVVRDIVRDEAGRPRTLGTAFVLQLMANLLIVSVAVGLWLFAGWERTIGLMVLILAIGQLGQSLAPIEYWFKSQIKSRYILLAKGGSILVASGLKVALILTSAALWMFAGAVAVDMLLCGLGLALMYKLAGHSFGKWRIGLGRARELLGESWPLVLSSIAVVTFLRIDQVMLQQMKGAHELGLYSAAVRVSELWYFVPTAIASSVFPMIVAARERDPDDYHHKLGLLFGFLGGLSVLAATVMTFGGGLAIQILYGAQYDGAGTMLAIHVWAGVPVALAAAFGPWMFAEGHARLSLHRTVTGAILNIVLNLVLIPRYGGIGAAVATIISQLWAAVLGNIVHPATRRGGMMQLRGLLPTSWFRAVSHLLTRNRD